MWPWKITQLLAQLYSAPFLSYGIGSLLLARRQTWNEVRIPVTATLVFALGVLIASILHRALFSAADLSDRLWFISFTIASLMLALLSIRAFTSAAYLEYFRRKRYSMPYASQILNNPFTGERIIFEQTEQDTDGALVAFEHMMLPRKTPTFPEHVQLNQEERFEILSGTTRFRLESRRSGSYGRNRDRSTRGNPHQLLECGSRGAENAS